MELEGELCPAIVTGIKLGKSLTPGQVSVEFAVAHYTRIRTYNCVSRKSNGGLASDCGMFRLLQIMYNSERDSFRAIMGVHIDDWERETKKKMEGLVKKHIVTGNIVRSYISDSMEKGRHIVFSDMNGNYHHGVLLSSDAVRKTRANVNCHIPFSEAMSVIINQGLVNYRFPVNGLPDLMNISYDGWYSKRNFVFTLKGAKNSSHRKTLKEMLNQFAAKNCENALGHFVFLNQETIKVYIDSPCFIKVVDYFTQYECTVVLPNRDAKFLSEDVSEAESWPIVAS